MLLTLNTSEEQLYWKAPESGVLEDCEVQLVGETLTEELEYDVKGEGTKSFFVTHVADGRAVLPVLTMKKHEVLTVKKPAGISVMFLTGKFRAVL